MVLAEAARAKADDETDACQKLRNELKEIDERLRILVETYEEMPSIIDQGELNVTDRASGMEAMISKVYQIMRTRIYVEDSPLRVEDGEIWDAFLEQKSEFDFFYRCTLRELEIYKEVLLAYRRVKDEVGPAHEPGYLQKIRQDTQALADARDDFIEALSNFYGKFSAMLTVFVN